MGKKMIKKCKKSIVTQDNDSDGWSPEIKRRRRFSLDELQLLETIFSSNNCPTQDDIQEIAYQLKAPRKNITTWFQNRRAKNKRKERLSCNYLDLDLMCPLHCHHDSRGSYIAGVEEENSSISPTSFDFFNQQQQQQQMHNNNYIPFMQNNHHYYYHQQQNQHLLFQPFFNGNTISTNCNSDNDNEKNTYYYYYPYESSPLYVNPIDLMLNNPSSTKTTMASSTSNKEESVFCSFP